MWTLWNYKYDMVFPQYCLLYRGITLFVFTFSSFVVVLKCIKRREDITAFWTFLFSLLLTNRSTCSAVKIKKKSLKLITSVWQFQDKLVLYNSNRVHLLQRFDLHLLQRRRLVFNTFYPYFFPFFVLFQLCLYLLHSVSTLSINFKIIFL